MWLVGGACRGGRIGLRDRGLAGFGRGVLARRECSHDGSMARCLVWIWGGASGGSRRHSVKWDRVGMAVMEMVGHLLG